MHEGFMNPLRKRGTPMTKRQWRPVQAVFGAVLAVIRRFPAIRPAGLLWECSAPFQGVTEITFHALTALRPILKCGPGMTESAHARA